MFRQISISLLVCVLLTAFAGPAYASENTSVHVMAPFARAVPKVVKNAAAYMVLRSYHNNRIVLTGMKGDVAKSIELHRSFMDNGMMKMQPVARLALEPGEVVEFKPGGYHIMLVDLRRQLKEGDSFQLILMFDDGSERHVQVPVKGLGAMPMPMHQHQHQNQDHQHQHEHRKQDAPNG